MILTEMSIRSTTKVYQLTTTNLGGVIGVQTDGEYDAGEISRISLSTRPISVQTVTYQFKARINDIGPGHKGSSVTRAVIRQFVSMYNRHQDLVSV